ncbi:MAG: GNAT family N-acetyltransferase [Phycisphaerales bacterium]|nr:GNAT family N-acetyltransferase [Phycisphaerales bacterium]
MMPEGVRLRPASNADGEAVRSLIGDVLREFGLVCDTCGIDADLLDLERAYHQGGGRFDVLETCAPAIVGTVGLVPIREGVCELRKMYLRPAWRGRGLGRRLLVHAIQQARELGFRRMELETAAVLTDAIRLYESFGFVPISSGHMASRCDLAYALDLQPPGDG